MKKIICTILSFLVIFSLVSCTSEQKLQTPTNVKVTENGLITWDKVENATSYIVSINELDYECFTNEYQYDDTSKDFTFTVYAKAKGFESSDKSEVVKFTSKPVPTPIVPQEDIKIGIVGPSEVRSGKTAKLKANVTGASNTNVTWSITKGSNYASISEYGVVTANPTDTEHLITVKCASVQDPKIFVTKILTIVSKPVLTQEMLDNVSMDTIGFEGYINISVYAGVSHNAKLEQTVTTVVKTSMDGNNWYAEYINGDTGTKMGLYYTNHNGIACEVGVSLLNDDQYYPMTDDDNNDITWQDAGFYNNIKGLKVSDFEFNSDTWRYEYVGSDKKLPEKLIASANPYDFEQLGFSLIIEDDAIMGIYSKAKDNFTIASGKRSVQELIVAINYGDTVEVPTIKKFELLPEHEDLGVAIKNMQALNNFTVDFKETTGSAMAPGTTEKGFTEYVTPDHNHFVPYNVTYDFNGKEDRTPMKDSNYGFIQKGLDLYNSYYQNKEAVYEADRAYAGTVKDTRPTFAFSPAIFSKPVVAEDGSKTYFVAEIMSRVATTLYYGMGNDINLYGIFASRGYISQNESFTPYVVVKDGYITEAGFYFYMGSIFGVVQLEYSNFNNTTVPEDHVVEFTKKELPTSWDQLVIQVPTEGKEDEAVNALTWFKKLYADENIGERLPFFGTPLGDTFGFGLQTIYHPKDPQYSHQTKTAVVLYYDVALDYDYTINSKLKAIDVYLKGLGFDKNKYDEYIKDDICVYPSSSSLDLLIYVWKK